MAVFPPTVRVIVNGEPVDAAITNGPISDLTNRTDWLKAQLESMLAGSQLLLRQQSCEAGLVKGTPVYLDGDIFKAAQAEIDVVNLNLAGPRSFWQGIILDVSGQLADIVIGGTMTLTTGEWASVFDDGVFASGNIYLSGTGNGKITASPDTTAIYLGYMKTTGEFLVRLGSQGSFLDHIHIETDLVGDPAGDSPIPAPGNPQVISPIDPNEQGWLPANSTYFPGFVVGNQIPTGAVYGYNIQHPAETELRSIFPVLPPENAQFSQAGSILYPSLVQTNNYGIWWMDDSYGLAPWPVDYNTTQTADPIYLWTTRIIASATIYDAVFAELIAQIEDGTLDPYLVTSVLSGNPDSLEISGTEGDGTNGWRGQVTLTNAGVTAARYGRGLTISSADGDNTTGYKGLLDFEFDAELPASHLWTELTVGSDKVVLLTTNGVSSGSTISMRGHRLGATVGTDWIDFIIPAGPDLEAATDYQVIVTFNGCVDTISGAATAGQVDVEFYRLPVGSPVSTDRFIRTERPTFFEGLPGQWQSATLGPYADVVLQQNEALLVRVKNGTGGSPLTPDTLRLSTVTYRMDKV